MKKVIVLIPILIFWVVASAFPIKCGTWRWSVKTLTDNSGIDWFSLTPTPITIHTLIKQKPPKKLSTTSATDTKLKRYPGTAADGGESELVTMDVYIYRIKTTEGDHDYHLLLSSTDAASGEKMDGEIPATNCTNLSGHTDLITAYKDARAVADKVNSKLHHGQKFVKVRIVGVPLWDAPHGAAGAPANGREIHPIIKMEIL
jgi:hypothetical protein